MLRRHVERFRIDIDEHWAGADPRDATGRGEKSVCRRDHGIARAKAERHKNGEERVCSGGNSDRVISPAVISDSLLEVRT